MKLFTVSDEWVHTEEQSATLKGSIDMAASYPLVAINQYCTFSPKLSPKWEQLGSLSKYQLCKGGEVMKHLAFAAQSIDSAFDKLSVCFDSRFIEGY